MSINPLTGLGKKIIFGARVCPRTPGKQQVAEKDNAIHIVCSMKSISNTTHQEFRAQFKGNRTLCTRYFALERSSCRTSAPATDNRHVSGMLSSSLNLLTLFVRFA